jgi:hypothetical protein
MSAARIQQESKFWFRRLDARKIEKVRIPNAPRWIDADEGREPAPRAAEPAPTKRFTLWDV